MSNSEKDFKAYANSLGISSLSVDYYKDSYINPTILEERKLNVSQMDIFSRLQMDRILFLGTEIDSTVSNIITAQMLWLDQQSDNDIQLYVNSPGGSVYDGYQILDTMNFIKSDVATSCLGMSASMGAIIFSSGQKGKRSIIPHGRFMIHQPIGGTGRSQASDIEIVAKEINKLKTELYTILADNSNLSIEEIEKMADRDCWMTSDETIKYGFADKLIV